MTCSHCQAEVPHGARMCKECGSDFETGWSQHAEHHGLLDSEPMPAASTPTPRWVRTTTLWLLLFGLASGAWYVGLPAWLAIAAAVFIAFAIWRLRRDPRPARRKEHFRELVQRLRGDAGQAERLVEYEMKRAPELSRDAAIRRALSRLEHDRR